MAVCTHPSLVAACQKLLNELSRNTFYKLSEFIITPKMSCFQLLRELVPVLNIKLWHVCVTEEI